jgi:ribose transport system substrate-binding protein
MNKALVRISVIAAVLTGVVFAAGTGPKSLAATAGSHTHARTYTIYLSNNFLGNDWRQQMERSARVAVQKAPLKGRVNLIVENVATTVQAQINSLNNIISRHPDAILIDAGSGTALNPVIQRACAQRIIVISFDQVVTSPCAFKMESNWNIMPRVLATWIAKVLNGKGNVFMDRGLPGAPISAQIQNGYTSVLNRYPGIKVVGYFNGNYAFGPEQSGVAALLAAHPNVDGILTQGYGAASIKALQQAGHKLVPVIGYSYNVSMTTCAKTPGAQCAFGSNAAYISAEAIRLAVRILDGKASRSPRHIYLYTPYYVTTPVAITGYPHVVQQKIRIGVNAFPNLPGGLSLPFSPKWVHITPREAAGR